MTERELLQRASQRPIFGDFARLWGKGRSAAALLLGGVLTCMPGGAQTSRVSGDQTRILTNIQTTTAYTIQAGDCGKLVSFASSSPVAVTLPQAGTVIVTGCWIELQNAGAGTVTITANVSTIDGSESVPLASGAGMKLISSGGQYYTQRGQAGAGSGGSGTVTASSANQLAYYSSAGTTVSGSGCTVGGSANADLTCGSLTSNGVYQGEIDFYPAANAATYVGLAAPSSVPATYTMQLPGNAPSNQLLSFGPPANGVAIGSWVNAVVLVGIGPVASIPFAYSFSGLFYLATDSSDCVNGGGSASTLCLSNGSAWTPINGGSSGAGGGNTVSGGSNLTSAGVVPFENGTAGAVTQDSGFVYDSTNHRLTAGNGSDSLTIGTAFTGYGGVWVKASPPTAANYAILGDGGNTFFNAPTGGLFFRVGNTDVVRMNYSGVALQIPSLAAKTGTRYVCVDASGSLVSQVTPCSGT